MDYLLIQATNGLVIGIIYALVAVGVTLRSESSRRYA